MFNNNSNCGLALLGIALGLGIIGGAYIVGNVAREIKLDYQSIEVKGYAERAIASDLAVWTCRVSAKDSSLEGAYKKLQEAEANFDLYLKKAGVASENIEKLPANKTEHKKRIPSTQAYSGYVETNEIELYEVNRTFSVKMKDVFKVKEIAENSSVLAEHSVDLQTAALQFFSTELGNVKAELLGEATKNATERAEQLAKNSGSKIGVLQSARQGVFQITSAHSTDVSDYGISDTSSVNKKATAVVSMTFSIRK